LRDLDTTKANVTEKDRLIKQRDALLESHALESRKLADMLDKERQSHRTTKHQFETFQKTQQHTTRTLSHQESRVLELETSRQQDRRTIATLENKSKDQMTERNNLLLALWNRLSKLCGEDWTHNNKLINGRALPSIETVATMFPGFSKNLLAAVKMIETLVSDFHSRIRSVEKDLWKEYQTLETNLEVRTKRLDRLETMVRSAIPSMNEESRAEISKLRDMNKKLRVEINTLRAANDVRAGAFEDAPSPSPSVPTGPRHKTVGKSRTSTMTRHHSSSAVETFDRVLNSRGGTSSGKPADDNTMSGLGSPSRTASGSQATDNDWKWQIKLQALEQKLKMEREGRELDRDSARQRLKERSRENAELMKELERNRVKTEMEKARQGGLL
jgi:hypothetical protein